MLSVLLSIQAEELNSSANVKINKDYPLLSKGSQFKEFGQGFIDLWKQLPSALGVRYLSSEDGSVIQLLDWMVHLSHAAQRSIRHAGCISSLAFGLGLIETIHEIEDKKFAVSTPTQKNAAKQVSLLESQKSALINLLKGIQSDVFVNRYRDVSSAVRKDSIRMFSQWLMEFPSEFLKNEYLKYFGWLLNDRAAEVRRAALQSVYQLLNASSNFAKTMSAFLEKFRPRFLEMIRDIDDEVAIEALNVLTTMLGESFLKEDDGQAIEELIVCHDSTPVKESAAKFLLEYIPAFQRDYTPLAVDEIPTDKKKRHIMFDQLLSFVDLCERHLGALEGVDENEASLIGGGEIGVPCQEMTSLVEAMWNKPGAEVLCDWDVLTSLFLEDQVAQELSPTQQKLTATLMKEAARQLFLTWKSQTGRSQAFRMWHDRYRTMTDEITRKLAKLCEQHLAEPGVLIELYQMASFMDLNTLVENERTNSISHTLDVVKQSIQRHHSIPFIRECTALLSFFSECGHTSLADIGNTVCSDICESLVQEMDQIVSSYHSGKKRSRKSVESTSFSFRGLLNRTAGIVSGIPIHRIDSRFMLSGSFTKSIMEMHDSFVSEEYILQLDQFHYTEEDSEDNVYDNLRPLFESMRSILQYLFSMFLWACQPLINNPDCNRPGTELVQCNNEQNETVSFESALKGALEWRNLLIYAADQCLRFQFTPKRLKTKQLKGADAYSLSVNMSALHCFSDISQFCNEKLRRTYLRQLFWVPSQEQARILREVAEKTMSLYGDELRNCCGVYGEQYYELRRSLVMQVEKTLEREDDDTEDVEKAMFRRSLEDHLVDRSNSLKVEQVMKPLCQMVSNCRIEQDNPQAEFAAIVLSHAVEQEGFRTPLGGSSSAILSKSILNIAKSYGPEQTLVVHLSVLQSCFRLVLEAQRELSAAYEGEYDDEENVDELLNRSEQLYIQRVESMREVSKKLASSLGVGKLKGDRLLATVRMLQRAVTYAVDDLQRIGFLSYLEPYLNKISNSDQSKLLSRFCLKVIEQLSEEDQQSVEKAKSEVKKNKTQDDIDDVNAAPWVPFAEFLLNVEGFQRTGQRSPKRTKTEVSVTAIPDVELNTQEEAAGDGENRNSSSRDSHGRRSLVSAMAASSAIGVSQSQDYSEQTRASLSDVDDELLVRKPSQLDKSARVQSSKKKATSSRRRS